MRALLDILEDERSIIERIHRVEKEIIRVKDEESRVRGYFVEIGAPSYLSVELTELDNNRSSLSCDLHAEKTKLHNIRNEIKMYFHDLKYGEEDVMSNGD